jgi:hypothetical protein
LNQRPPGYEFKWAGSQNTLSLVESVVLSAYCARFLCQKQGFCAHFAPTSLTRFPARTSGDQKVVGWLAKQPRSIIWAASIRSMRFALDRPILPLCDKRSS